MYLEDSYVQATMFCMMCQIAHHPGKCPLASAEVTTVALSLMRTTDSPTILEKKLSRQAELPSSPEH